MTYFDIFGQTGLLVRSFGVSSLDGHGPPLASREIYSDPRHVIICARNGEEISIVLAALWETTRVTGLGTGLSRRWTPVQAHISRSSGHLLLD